MILVANGKDKRSRKQLKQGFEKKIFLSLLLSIFWRTWAKLLHSVQKRYKSSPTCGVQNWVTTNISFNEQRSIMEFWSKQQVFVVEGYLYYAYTMRQVWKLIMTFLHDRFDRSFLFINMIASNKCIFNPSHLYRHIVLIQCNELPYTLSWKTLIFNWYGFLLNLSAYRLIN
jgi:hypothetical protein